MSVALDLTHRHFTRERGDLVLIGTWIRVEGRWRPCLVLVRPLDLGRDVAVPCVVTLDKAWIWSEDVGDLFMAATTTADFLHALRMEPSNRNINRIRAMIHDHLGDLMTIPPYRAGERAAVADAVLTDQYGRARELEIVDDV